MPAPACWLVSRCLPGGPALEVFNQSGFPLHNKALCPCVEDVLSCACGLDGTVMRSWLLSGCTCVPRFPLPLCCTAMLGTGNCREDGVLMCADTISVQQWYIFCGSFCRWMPLFLNDRTGHSWYVKSPSEICIIYIYKISIIPHSYSLHLRLLRLH